MEELKGQWLNDYVQVLASPFLDEKSGKWCALANAWGTLAFIELKVTQAKELQS
jgi:hypothetical protein